MACYMETSNKHVLTCFICLFLHSRDWLTTTGSPHSTISNCECEVEEITSEQLPYDAFNVVH